MVDENAGQSPHGDTGRGSKARPQPIARKVELEDIFVAVRAGVKDFRTAPVYGLFFGLVFAVGGNLVVATATMLGHSYLSYPLAVAFWLVGPFIAVGIYEVSRRIETKQKIGWGPVLGVMWAQHRRELSWMAFVVMFVQISWMFQVRLLLALFFGFRGFKSLEEFMMVTITTFDGLLFLVVGHIVGALFSLVLFSVTVVSFPLLLERDYDFVTAMITSVKVVLSSPVVMIGWGLAITVILIASMLPAFIGLLFTLPILGHTTWHLYKRAVIFPNEEERSIA